MTNSLAQFQNVQELHVLQEEIVKCISTNRSFYLRIDDSGPEKTIKIATGLGADIWNFFGSEKFDLEKVLSVFEAKVKKAQEELQKGALRPTDFEQLTYYQNALVMVVDLIAFKYGEWKLKNYRPKRELSLEERAMQMRDAFFFRIKLESAETPVALPAKEIVLPKVETQAQAAAQTLFVKTVQPLPPVMQEMKALQETLLLPLWACQKAEERSVGWEFTDEGAIFREKTIRGDVKEEVIRDPDLFFTKMKVSLEVALIDFRDMMLSSCEKRKGELVGLSSILYGDFQQDLQKLKEQLIGLDTKEELAEYCKRLANYMLQARAFLAAIGITMDGQIHEKVKKEARILLLILQLKTLAKLSIKHSSQQDNKESALALAKKALSLVKETDFGFHKEGYLKCLLLLKELQSLDLSSTHELLNDYLAKFYQTGLDLLVSLDKETKERSHFLKDDRHKPARIIFERLYEAFGQKRFSEGHLHSFNVLVDAFLAKPDDKESWRSFLVLELQEFKKMVGVNIALEPTKESLKHFCEHDQVKAHPIPHLSIIRRALDLDIDKL